MILIVLINIKILFHRFRCVGMARGLYFQEMDESSKLRFVDCISCGKVFYKK